MHDPRKLQLSLGSLLHRSSVVELVNVVCLPLPLHVLGFQSHSWVWMNLISVYGAAYSTACHRGACLQVDGGLAGLMP